MISGDATQLRFFVVVVYAYKGREVPEVRVGLGLSQVRPRCGRSGNFRTGSSPASLTSVLHRGRQISEFFYNVKMCACCLLRIKGLGSKTKK